MHNPITEIKIKDITLSVIYDKTYSRLYEYFSIDDRMHHFLNNNINEALLNSISKIDNHTYTINIASTIIHVNGTIKFVFNLSNPKKGIITINGTSKILKIVNLFGKFIFPPTTFHMYYFLYY